VILVCIITTNSSFTGLLPYYYPLIAKSTPRHLWMALVSTSKSSLRPWCSCREDIKSDSYDLKSPGCSSLDYHLHDPID
jgi:hypothetical protein